MSFVIPEDPFTRELGRTIQGLGENFGNAITERRKKAETEEQNYQFARSLGYEEVEARNFASMTSQQIALAGKQRGQQQQLDSYSNFLLESLDIEKDSPKGKAFKNAQDIATLTKMGGFEIKRKNKESPFQLSKERRLKKEDLSKYYTGLITDMRKNMRNYGFTKEQVNIAGKELKQEEFKNRKLLEKGKEPKTDAIEKYFKLFEEKEEKASPGVFDRIGDFLSGKVDQQKGIPQQQSPEQQFPQQQAPIQQQQAPIQQQQAPIQQQQAPQQQEKIPFDASNPEHIQKHQELLEEARRTSKTEAEAKAKANKKMNEIFS
jgi:hypothetical protein